MKNTIKKDNTLQIEDNLVRNLARVFTEYGWAGRGAPKTFEQKINIIAYGLTHGEAFDYATHLKLVIQARRKDHKWGMYTPVFVEGVLTLLNAFAGKHNYFERKPLARSHFYDQPYGEVTEDNVFETIGHAKEAVKRLEAYGKTTVRYSLIEDYGEEKVERDLRKAYPGATLSIHRDEHVPDQLREWLYDGGVTKMTVMYPIMPLVYITLNN